MANGKESFGASPPGFPVETPEERQQRYALKLRTLEMERADPQTFYGNADPETIAALDKEIEHTKSQLGVPASAPAQPERQPARPPTWSEVINTQTYQSLNEEEKESVRLSYWRDIVSPNIPTEHAEAAKREFDRRTKRTLATRVGETIGRVFGRQQSAQEAQAPTFGDMPIAQWREEVERQGAESKEGKWGEFRTGIEAGVTGAHMIGAAAAMAPVVSALQNLDKRLELYDKVDKGEWKPQAARLWRMPSYAEEQAAIYASASPEGKRMLREDALRSVAENSEVRDKLRSAWELFSNHMQQTQGRVPNLTDVRSFEDFRDWFAFSFGQIIPYIPTFAALGIIGGAPAIYGGAHAMGVGDITSEQLERGKPLDPGSAFAFAVPYAALEHIGAPMQIARAFRNIPKETLEKVAESYFRRAGREVPKNAIGEFFNEAGQRVITDVAVAGKNDPIVTEEALLSWLNEGAAGAAAAPFGLISAIPGGKRSAAPQQKPGEKSVAEKQQVEQPSTEQQPEGKAPQTAGIDSEIVLGREEGEEPASEEKAATEAPVGPVGPGPAVDVASGPKPQPPEVNVAPQQIGREAVAKPREAGEIAAPQQTVVEEKPLTPPAEQTQKEVDEAAHEAATSPENEQPEPTEAQKEAGNYKKGHATIGGLDISIENPQGSERSGVDSTGRQWSVTMRDHYGYIRGTKGKDKNHLDVFVKPGTPEALDDSAPVYIVDQRKPGTDEFDQHKVMLGYGTEEEARVGYRRNYEKGWRGILAVTKMPLSEFKRWIKEGDTTKPAYYTQPSAPMERTQEKWADTKTPLYEHLTQKFRSGNWSGGFRIFDKTGKRIIAERLPSWTTATFPTQEEAIFKFNYPSMAEAMQQLLARLNKGERIEGVDQADLREKAEKIKSKIEFLKGAKYATETGRQQAGGEREHRGDGEVVQGEGKDRERAPEKPSPRPGDRGGGGVPKGGPLAPPKAPVGGEQQVAGPQEKGEREGTEPKAAGPKQNGKEPVEAEEKKRKDKDEAPGKEQKPQGREKEPEEPAKKEPSARESLHQSVLDAIENDDRHGLAKLLFLDAPFSEENWPRILPEDRIIRIVVKEDNRAAIERRLDEIGFRITDKQDVSADDTKNVLVSAIYRPAQEKIGDLGDKMAGKRKDEYREKISKEHLPTNVEKAVAQILRAVDKDQLLPAERPGQSFGQFMFLEALWAHIMPAIEYIGRGIGSYKETKSQLLEDIAFAAQTNMDRVLSLAENYAGMLAALDKAVQDKTRVEETATALKAALTVKEGPPGTLNELGTKIERLMMAPALETIEKFARLYSANEDSTDQTNRFVKKPMDQWPAIKDIKRHGKDWREGKNVTGDDFIKTFGFRGVDFGNWVTGPERQASLNYAYDALMDLADALGIPPKGISLGGSLGLGFGARGRGGKAAATYLPDLKIINLTKPRGDGSLGHEWMHALEDHISATGVEMHVRHLRDRLKVRPRIDVLERMFREKLKEDKAIGKDRNVPPKERALEWLRRGGWQSGAHSIMKDSAFYKNALKLDNGEVGKYWSKPEELVARASEAFQYDLVKGGSPYLVGSHAAEGAVTPKNGYQGIAYPLKDEGERDYINHVMRLFFQNLEFTNDAVRIKEGAKTVTVLLYEEVKKAAEDIEAKVDRIMEEEGILQWPEIRDGSMVASMFYHLRHGWWPQDKAALRRFVAQAHRKDASEIDDLTLRNGVEDFEAALARYAGQLVHDWKEQGKSEREIFDLLFGMYNKQPVLDVRTSTVVQHQQYSTPLPIAYAAALMAHVDDKSVVYDPTAGNGLLVFAANPKRVIANELDERRAKNVGLIEMRSHLGDALTAKERGVYKDGEADAVLANPPFGLLSDAQEIDGHTIKRIDQLIVAKNLDAMADNGRAVLILGAARDAGVINQIELDFFHWLYTRYNVVDHFEITGKLYARQGASWPIRVIVIAGRSPSKLGRPENIQRLETRDDIWSRVLEARAKAATPVAERVPAGVVGAEHPGKGRDDRSRKPGDDDVGVPQGAGGQGVLPAERGGLRGGKGRGGVRIPAGETGVAGHVGATGMVGDDRVRPALSSGEPGARGAGERGRGAEGSGEAERPQLGNDALGGHDLDDLDLDQLIGPIDQEARTPTEEELKEFLDRTAEIMDGGDAAARAKDLDADPPDEIPEPPKLMAEGGPPLDGAVYAKLRPAFDKAWSQILAKAKAIRDAIIAFTEWVKKNYKEWVLPYARHFIAEIYNAAKEKAARTEVIKPVPSPHQALYEGLSKGDMDGVMMPKDHVVPIKRALAELDARIRNEFPGGVDHFVRAALGYESDEQLHKHLYGYQIDGIALALDSMLRGKGFIIGDDTGVGKGRPGAALAVWAIRTGRIPIFFTANDNLYSEFYRDLAGLGFANPEWLQPTNSDFEIKDEDNNVVRAPEKGEPTRKALVASILKKLQNADPARPETYLPPKRKIILTTYSQMNLPHGAPARELVEKLVATGRAVLILDESHNAAGESSVGEWMRGLLDKYRPMTTYLSATFSKRADTLPVYLMTDLRLVAPNLAEMVSTITAGGMQMQSTISEMLVEAGQMIRRERSYMGIKLNWVVDDENAPRDARTMDAVTERLRAIFFANNELRDMGQDVLLHIVKKLLPKEWVVSLDPNKAIDVDAANFSAVAHNYVKQFLLAVKADRIVANTIKAINEQQKPVIALENTMESALDYYVDSIGAKTGDELPDFSWASVMEKALERSRQVSVRVAGKSEKMTVTIPLAMLPADVRQAYEKAKKLIDEFKSDLPVSPIDYLKWRLSKYQVWQDEKGLWHAAEKAPDGVKARPLVIKEVTGRNKVIKYGDDGRATLGTQEDTSRRDVIFGFNEGTVDAVIVNVAGSTGVSLHASVTFKDRRQRHLIVGQPLGDISLFKQLLGRIHRTGQVRLPLYSILSTALPSEKRPLAVLRKKFQHLTSNIAATTTSAQDFEVTDFINEYGDEIVTRWLREHDDIAQLLDIAVPDREGRVVNDVALKASGRVALLSVADQEEFYDDIEHQYNSYIEQLTAHGLNRLIRRDLPLEAQILGEQMIEEGAPSSHSPFEGPAFLQKLSVRTLHDVPRPSEIFDALERAFGKPADTEDETRFAAALRKKVEDDLKIAYDEALNQLGLKIAEYRKKLEDTSLAASERRRLENALNAARDLADAFPTRKKATLKAITNDFLPGEVFKFQLDDEELVGVVAAVHHAKPARGGTGNPYAPSRFSISIITNAPRPRLVMSLAMIERANPVVGRLGNALFDTAGKDAVETYFDPAHIKKVGGRENRYMIVGNIPAGYGIANAAGEIVVFTYDGHTADRPKVRTGVLLPRAFNPERDLSNAFALKDADAVERLVMLPRDHGILVKQHHAEHAEMEAARRRWLNMDFSAAEIFDIATNGVTAYDGMLRIYITAADPKVILEVQRTTGYKDIITSKPLLEAMGGAEFSQGTRARPFQAFMEADRLGAVIRYLLSSTRITADPKIVSHYRRIREELDRRRRGDDVLLMPAEGFPRKPPTGDERLEASLGADGNLDVLRRSIERALGKELPKAMFVRAKPSPADAARLKELGDFFGKTIHLFRNTRPDIFDFQGAFVPGNSKVVFVNENTQSPTLVVAGHEILHALKDSDPKLYEAIRDALRPHLVNHAGYEAYLKGTRSKLASQQVASELVEEEMIADLLGDALRDRRFFERLMGREPSLAQRLMEMIGDLLARLGFHLGRSRRSDRFVRDVHEARQVLLSVLRQGYQRDYVAADGKLAVADASAPKLHAAPKTATERLWEDVGLVTKILRAPFILSGYTKLVHAAAQKLHEINEKLTEMSPAWEAVRAGFEDKYGLDETYRRLREEPERGRKKWARGIMELHSKIRGMSRQQAIVLNEWMTSFSEEDLDRMPPDVAERLIAQKRVMSALARTTFEQLPPSEQQTLRDIRELVAMLGQEMVNLGLLSQEVYDRNKLAYLHRSYLAHEVEETKLSKLNDRLRFALLGDTLKGKGLTDWREHSKLSEWAKKPLDPKEMKGKMFQRLEKRGPPSEKDPKGRLLKVAYIPADQDIPLEYASWRREGIWEVRWHHGGKWGLWRDFTKEEQKAMAVIDDVRYNVVKTLLLMTHDVEVAKAQKKIADMYARDSVPEGGRLLTAHEARGIDWLAVYRRNTWVQVPDTKITGTNIKRYGPLAGKFIPGPIWNDIRQNANLGGGGVSGVVAKLYDDVQRYWKVAHTALSPVVHTNNVMANVLLMYAQDIRAKDVIKALRVLLDAKLMPLLNDKHVPDPDNQRLYNSFEDSGATLAMFTAHELRRDIMLPMLESIQKGMLEDIKKEALNDEHTARMRVASAISMIRAAMWSKDVVKKWGWDVPIEVYQFEDEVFRMAAFLKATRAGMKEAEAGRFAKEAFLDYDITAPWIQVMRRTGWPFIAFNYRAIPKLIRIAIYQPWKLLAIWGAAEALNALTYAMLGLGEDDEDIERKRLPIEKQGRIWGLFPKMFRMPWNSEADFGLAFDRMLAGDTNGFREALRKGEPVFLDVRRFFPSGDVFDIYQGSAALPVPPPLMPGGVLAMLAEVFTDSRNFTGERITQWKKEFSASSEMTWTEALEAAARVGERFADYQWKFWTPNFFMVPGTWSFDAIRGAGGFRWLGLGPESGSVTDIFGRERSLPQAIASAFGWKLQTYPADVAKLRILSEMRQATLEYQSAIRTLERQLAQRKIDRDEYEKERDYQTRKFTRSIEYGRKLLEEGRFE